MHQFSPHPKIFHQISFATTYPLTYIHKLRLYTHTKHYNNSCISWAVIELWFSRVAIQPCHFVNFLIFFLICVYQSHFVWFAIQTHIQDIKLRSFDGLTTYNLPKEKSKSIMPSFSFGKLYVVNPSKIKHEDQSVSTVTLRPKLKSF